MNSTLKFLFLSLFLALFSAKTGWAQSANVTSGCSPLEVKFTAPSGSSTYYWDFKDGVTSNLQNPTSVFTRSGTYNVEFKESSSGPVVGTVQIKVFVDPKINIHVPLGCAPLNAQLQNTSVIDPAIAITNYVWVFGDGQSSQGVENVSHVYANPGKYDVSFSIQTQYPTCNRTVIFTDAVEVITPPVADFSTDPPVLSTCKDKLIVSFSNHSTGVKPLTYAWSMGNGVTTAATNPPTQTYLEGQYNASLTASYAGITGCSSVASKPISVGSPKPIIILQDDTLCINLGKAFSTHTIGNHLWNFGPNAVSSDPTLTSDSMNVYFTKAGTQTISLTVTSFDGQCSATKTAKIYVDEVTAKLVATPTFGCSSPFTIQYKVTSNQTKVNYNWLFSDGTTAVNVTSINKTFYSSTASDYFSKNDWERVNGAVFVTSKITGCQTIAGEEDTLWLPNALFMPNQTKGCIPLNVEFSDSSKSAPNNEIISRVWLFGDGTSATAANAANVIHSYTVPGEYMARLVVKTKKGCVDTSYAVLIEVGKDLSSQINFTSNKTAVCPGEQVQFTTQVAPATAVLIDGYHFGSEGNRVFHCTNQTTVPWTYTNLAGPQNVSLTVDYNGCFSTITKPAFVNVKGAIAKIDYASSCDQPKAYHFINKSQNATTLSWDFGDAQNSSIPDLIHTYAASGDYTVQLTASDPASGCAPTKDSKKIYVRQLQSKIMSDTLLCIGQPYSLSGSTSTDVYADCHKGYTWQFQGPEPLRPYTSSQSSTSFSFPKRGNYTATLITQDINGCKDTATTKLRVFEIRPKVVTDLPKVCLPNTVQFTDLSTSDTTIVSWQWNFNDTSYTHSSVQNPSVSFTAPPINSLPYYPVDLLIKDKLGCVKEYGPFNLGYYKPISSIAASDYTLCLGDSVTLSAPQFTDGGSNLAFTWDLGNGQTSTSQVNKILYTNPQVYNIKLKYAEAGSGCKDSTTLNLEVQSYPIAGIQTNVDSLAVLCAPQNVFFSDSTVSASPVTYYWDFGNGQTSTNAQFALFYAKGNYTATHIVQTSNGCADTTTQVFKVQSPEGRFTIDKNTICKGDEITFSLVDTVDVSTYTWAFGDGTTLNNIAPAIHRYNFHPVSGQAPARLIIRGVDGICPVETQKFINIRQVIANFERGIAGDTSLCFNDGPYPFKNTSISADTYAWDFGDLSSSVVENPTHQFPAAGVYDVTLRISNSETGCLDTITKQAVLYANPITAATGDTVCLGTPIQLKVINPVTVNHYLWTPSTGLSPNATSTSPVATINHTIVYELVETDTNGCADKVLVPAVVIEPINLNNLDTSIVIGDKVILPVYGPHVYHFNWTPTDGLSCLDCNFPVVQPLKDITYTLDVTDVRGCFNDTYFFKIKIRPQTFVKLPTTFTPNGDGTNDVLYVEGWGIKELLDFSIFNRWGQQIYSSSDIKEGWNGTFDGILQNSDVYVYKVRALTWRNEEVREEGYVNLLH